MQRRAFLGAAAALTALPNDVATDGCNDEPDCSTDGSSSVSMPRREGVWSAMEMSELVDEDATVSATGYAYDDEPSRVDLTVSTDAGWSLHLSLSPQQAIELAMDLEGAADHAVGGFGGSHE